MEGKSRSELSQILNKNDRTQYIDESFKAIKDDERNKAIDALVTVNNKEVLEESLKDISLSQSIRDNVSESLDTFAENSFFALEDVLYPFKPLNARVGDIFAIDEGLYFISYSEFIYPKKNYAGIASLTGGPAGGIAAFVGERDIINGAVQIASKIRTSEWGMKINERFQIHKNSIFIPREDIKHFRVTKDGTALIATSKSRYEFASKQIIEENTTLKDFLSGKKVFRQKHYNRYGIGIKFPAPSLVLEKLGLEVFGHELPSTAELDISVTILNKVVLNSEYMARLWGIFEGLSSKKQRGIVCGVRKILGPFAEKFGGFRSASVKNGKRDLMFGCALLVAGVMMCSYIALLFIQGRSEEPAGFLGLVLLILVTPTLAGGIRFVWRWFRSSRY